MNFLIRKIPELLTLAPAMQKQGRHIHESDLGFIPKAAMWIVDGKIQWLGPDHQIPRQLSHPKKKKLTEMHCPGNLLMPGFIECHTHSVFAGDRSDEFEARLQGVSYSEIAARGGGILSTMKKTREISAKALLQKTQEHVDRFVQQGVTTLEIKSGYALDSKNEIKMLKVLKDLEGPRIVKTYLGAHALPPEFANYESYLQWMQEEMLPHLKQLKLAERVDIFIENGFFPKDAARVFLKKAQELGFQVVIHADQLTLSGGADLACELSALSADHLIQLEAATIKKISGSSVTCVLLPAADLYMQCAYPPARALIEQGARVALATDFNPGTSPTQDLALVGLLARLQMKMSLPEVISAYTVGASFALGLSETTGSLESGKDADFLISKKSWTELFYSAGDLGIIETYLQGHKLNVAQKFKILKKRL